MTTKYGDSTTEVQRVAKGGGKTARAKALGSKAFIPKGFGKRTEDYNMGTHKARLAKRRQMM